MLLFLISGIWHGLSITFIIWGLIHGLMIILESILKKRKSKIAKPFFLQIKSIVGFCYSFLVVVFANIFFHADSLKEALIKIKLIFNQPFWVNDFLFEITAPFQGGGLPFDAFIPYFRNMAWTIYNLHYLGFDTWIDDYFGVNSKEKEI